MRVLVLGGDGFCGWPVALYLSEGGATVHIVDDCSRRSIDRELKTASLTPIAPLYDRVAAWNGLRQSTPKITVDVGPVEQIDGMIYLLESFKPDAIIHFAEQRSAPYSMRSPYHRHKTVTRNAAATSAVLAAMSMQNRDIHLVHLGTMGVYGYSAGGGEIPEGYIEWNGRRVLHPADPGSVYHTTKVLDQDLFQFYAKNDWLRITDLHQGIVWGTQTRETLLAPQLVNRFDYDGDYGTVLNRFLVQSVIGHPLTVYGSGGQTRAFIHIRDTCRCIALALQNPPAAGEPVRIRNQMAECLTVRALAAFVSKAFGGAVRFIENPRNEAPANNLKVSNRSFIEEGLRPVLLSEELAAEVQDVVKRYRDAVLPDTIMPSTSWRSVQVLSRRSPESRGTMGQPEMRSQPTSSAL